MLSGILKVMQKLGVPFSSNKQDVIDFTKISNMTVHCAVDTGHFFHTSLIQCLVFKGIVKGPESKIWAFFKGLRSFRGPQKQN